MKRYLLIGIPVVILLFALVSCEKDETTENESDVVDNATILHIKKIDGNDGYTNFSYDSINQLILMEDGPDDEMTMEYTYNNLGKISTMKITDSEGVNLTTFVYDTEGVLTGSSTGDGLADFTYEFDNGKLIKVNSYGNIPNLGRTLMVWTEFDYDGENISEFREFTVSFTTGNTTLSENVTYEHDTRKNPFYELNIENCVMNLGHEQFASKNNCTKRTVVTSTYGDEIGSYESSFDYNADGYPTQSDDGTLFTYYED
jgi:hypothetical protein